MDPQQTNTAGELAAEQEELDLNSESDQQLFLESAEGVFVDAMQYRSVAEADGYQQVGVEDVSGAELFVVMEEKLQELQEQVGALGYVVTPDEQEILTDEQVDVLQGMYDDMILLRDHIRGVYEPIVSAVETEETVDEQKSAIATPVQPAEREPITTGTASAVEELNTQSEEASTPVAATPEPKPTHSQRENNLVSSVPIKSSVSSARKGKPKVEKAQPSVPEGSKEHKSGRDQAKQSKPPAHTSDRPKPKSTIPAPKQNRKIHHQELQPAKSHRPPAPTKLREVRGTQQHREMVVQNQDAQTQNLSFRIAKETEQKLRRRQQKAKPPAPPPPAKKKESPSVPFKEHQFTPAVITEQLKAKNRGPLASVERRDPINRAVPGKRPNIIGADTVHEEISLTQKYLSDKRYQAFIQETYSSPSAFERMLDTTITQLEQKTVDPFERWLGEERASAFAFLAPQNVDEVLTLSEAQDIRTQAAEENVKYETLLVWLDVFPEMQEVVEPAPEMTFGELYARWMIESEMSYVAEQQPT